jgi:hypothetical protein
MKSCSHCQTDLKWWVSNGAWTCRLKADSPQAAAERAALVMDSFGSVITEGGMFHVTGEDGQTHIFEVNKRIVEVYQATEQVG